MFFIITDISCVQRQKSASYWTLGLENTWLREKSLNVYMFWFLTTKPLLKLFSNNFNINFVSLIFSVSLYVYFPLIQLIIFPSFLKFLSSDSLTFWIEKLNAPEITSL